MPASVSRRQLLTGSGFAAVGWASERPTALADAAFSPGARESERDILVTVFMRGGADGLNLLVPHAEDAYYRHRPSLSVPSPKDGRAAVRDRALDLDGFFGLHPALAPLLPLFNRGGMSFVHACGSNDHTRSHFEAMSAMERGLPNEETGTGSGWLARHLGSTEGENSSPLRAVAFSSTMPDMLRGATDATALNSLADFRLYAPSTLGSEAELRSILKDLYRNGDDAVSHAGRETLAVLETLNRLDPAHYLPGNGATYPKSDFGNGLRQVACLIKGRVGLEVACLDHRGPYLWDTHVTQNTIFGAQADDLAGGLAAFVADLGREMKRVTIVGMTEFGRRLQENSGYGTDHGRGGVMFLAGAGVVGGKVFRRWPGLSDPQLEEPGDLRVTTDYRDILAEIVQKRLHNDRLGEVFPDYTPNPVGAITPA